jgi:glycosidase
MREHDHELHITGIWEGDVMMDLHCTHADDDPGFFEDEEGNESAECLCQLWFDADRRDIFGTIRPEDADGQGNYLLYTTWNLDKEPRLVGKADFEDWILNNQGDD